VTPISCRLSPVAGRLSPVLLATPLLLALAAPAAAEPGDDMAAIPDLDELDSLEQLDQPAEGSVDEQLVRSAARVSLPLAEAPGIVTVIQAADLRAMGARSLFEALAYAPELDVTRDAFGFYHVAVRGRKNDAEVLVLLDGHRLNDFYDGRILYELPIAMIERIEILRGPGSALYGTSAFAGVISVYTRHRLGSAVTAQVATSGGDRDRVAPSSLAVAGYGGIALGRRWRGYGSVEASHQAGPRLLVPEDSLTRNRFDPDTGDSQSRSCDNQPVDQCPDTAYTSLPDTLIRASAAVDSRPGVLTDGDTLGAAVHFLYGDRGPFIGEYDTLTPDTRLRVKRVLGTVTYELPLRRDRSLAVASISSIDIADVDRDIQVAPDGFKELVEGRSELFPDGQLKVIDYGETVASQDLRLRWSLAARNSLVAGAQVEHTRMSRFLLRTNYDDSGRYYPDLGRHYAFPLDQDGQSRTVVGVYAEDLYSTGHGVHLVAGGRFDHYDDFGSAISPRTGAVWRRGDLSLKLFYGWAFRAPTFQELYDQTGRIDLGQFVGNPMLDASKVRTLESAALWSRSFDDLLLEATVTGAWSEISDSIDRAPLSGLNNTFLNTSEVTALAASAEVRLELAGRLAAFANGSWQSATADYQYVNPAQGLDVESHTHLRNVPPYRFNLGVRGNLDRRWSAGLFAEIGGPRRNNTRTGLEAQHFFDYPPYAIVQAYAQAAHVWRELYVRAAARNLTSAHVADEPFRPNRIPQGIPRDRLRIDVTVGMDF